MAKKKSPYIQVKIFDDVAANAAENLHRTGWWLQGKYVEFIKRLGITPQQFNVLGILRVAGKDGLPSLEVARRMIQKLPDITRLIDRLEKAGYVERERSTTDRRVVYCRITDSGLKIWKEVRNVLEDFSGGLLKSLTEEEVQELDRLLTKVRQQ